MTDKAKLLTKKRVAQATLKKPCCSLCRYAAFRRASLFCFGGFHPIDPEWRTFLTDLINQRLTHSFEVIRADGGQGLIFILSEVYPHIPLQMMGAQLDEVPKKQ